MLSYETLRDFSIRVNMLMGGTDMTVSASMGEAYSLADGAGKVAVGFFMWPINVLAAPIDWLIGRPTGFLHCQRAYDEWSSSF